MANLWVVRAEFGKYTKDFLNGGYVAAGWIPYKDLRFIKTRDEIEELYRQTYPDEPNRRVGANVGQIERFLLHIEPGDYIITPPDNTQWLYYGEVEAELLYYDPDTKDCPFPHRRKVQWAKEPLRRQEFSVPFLKTLQTGKTVFYVDHLAEFLVKIGAKRETVVPAAQDPYRVALDRILELSPKEFEELVGCLLEAVGFKQEVIGKTGDGGIDVRGEMDISSLHTLRMFVQVKHWRNKKVNASVVTNFRGGIPQDGVGAIITTSDYSSSAIDAAESPGFKPIRLIDGRQFVDLLVLHWDSIPEDFQDDLGLKRGLVLQ